MSQKLINDYFNFISKNKDIIKNIDNLDNVNLDNVILEIDKQIKKIKYAKFKGIIATHRSCKKETKKGYITFVTISTDNNHYIDIVIHGYHKVGKMMCLSGYGKLKEDSDCKWIDVIKWKNEYVN